jgi:hypothetical protein
VGKKPTADQLRIPARFGTQLGGSVWVHLNEEGCPKKTAHTELVGEPGRVGVVERDADRGGGSADEGRKTCGHVANAVLQPHIQGEPQIREAASNGGRGVNAPAVHVTPRFRAALDRLRIVLKSGVVVIITCDDVPMTYIMYLL